MIDHIIWLIYCVTIVEPNLQKHHLETFTAWVEPGCTLVVFNKRKWLKNYTLMQFLKTQVIQSVH